MVSDTAVYPAERRNTVTWLFALGFALALAVAVVSLALAVNAGNRADKLASQVANLNEQVANTKSQDLSSITSKLAAVQTQSSSTAKTVTHLTYCLPDLYAFIQSGNWSTYVSGTGSLSGGVYYDPNAISRFCSDILRSKQTSTGDGG